MVNDKKKTVIIGASSDPSRYAFLAAQMLRQYGHPFVPLSIHEGEVLGEKVQALADKPMLEDVHTITMYINSSHQKEWEDYLVSLQPKRIVFNPGAENQPFIARLKELGVEAVTACTLVMLRTGQY